MTPKTTVKQRKSPRNYVIEVVNYRPNIKGALSGLRQFLAAESSLNMMNVKSSFRSQDI